MTAADDIYIISSLLAIAILYPAGILTVISFLIGDVAVCNSALLVTYACAIVIIAALALEAWTEQ